MIDFLSRWSGQKRIDEDVLLATLTPNGLVEDFAFVLHRVCRQDEQINCWSSAFVAKDALTETEVSPYLNDDDSHSTDQVEWAGQ